MYLLLSLLFLYTLPVSAEVTIEQLCKEIAVETQIAVEDGIINEQVAEDLLQGCEQLK